MVSRTYVRVKAGISFRAGPVGTDGVFYRVDIDDGLLERLDASKLPSGWRTLAGRDGCRAIGEAWRSRHASVGLIVLSAAIPEAYEDGQVNVVLNPQHPAFASIAFSGPVPVTLDARLKGLMR